MAYTVSTQTLVDTNSKAVVHVDGECSSSGEAAVSGPSSVTTHGSTVGAFVEKSVSVTSIRWSVSTGQSAKLFYNGGTADQDICYLTGCGIWDSTNHFTPVGMGAAAGDAGSVLEILK